MMLLDCEGRFGTEERLFRCLTSPGANLLYNESKVECEPAETNQDETIEESFDDVIVSQETQASYCLKVFLKPSVQLSSVILATE